MTELDQMIAEGRRLVEGTTTYIEAYSDDARFIMWAKSSLPALLDALEAAVAEAEKWKAANERIRGYIRQGGIPFADFKREMLASENGRPEIIS